jgi:hypothetical protein
MTVAYAAVTEYGLCFSAALAEKFGDLFWECRGCRTCIAVYIDYCPHCHKD